MSDMQMGGGSQGGQGGQGGGQGDGYTGPDYSGGLHDPAAVQRYASEVEKLAAAVARDEKRAQELIDAVHSGRTADVEKVFRDAGVESRVSIERTDIGLATEMEGIGDIEGIGEVAADHTETTHTTQHYELHVDIGPIHLSAGFDKTTDTSSVTT
jgi:hypothetical protein